MMSVPSTISRFKEDASMSCGRMVAGRRLANAWCGFKGERRQAVNRQEALHRSGRQCRMLCNP